MHKSATNKGLNWYQKQYAMNFAAFTNEYLDQFQFNGVQTDGDFKGAIYSVSCGTHAVSTGSRFHKMKTLGTAKMSAQT